MADTLSFRAAFGVTEAAQAPLARRERGRAGFVAFAVQGGQGLRQRAGEAFDLSEVTILPKVVRGA